VNNFLCIIALMLQVLFVHAAEPYQCSAVDLGGDIPKLSPRHLRIATYNVFMNRTREGELAVDLQDPSDQLSVPEGADRQIRAVAEIIQRVRPDILLLNEFDYDSSGAALDRFQRHFLGVSQNDQAPIHFDHYFLADVNTGVTSGTDLNHDGHIATPGDSFGYGVFPGQYGMALLSRFPINIDAIRTFRTFLWKDMPGALLPDDPTTTAAQDWYEHEQLDVFRLSSKSHWDVPVQIDGQVVHLLAAHPTPPGFDGPEDLNGKRNHDEIRFWSDYVRGGQDATYIYDDQGNTGGLTPPAMFIILGDYNADINDGDTANRAIAQLLHHPRINARIAPASAGGILDALSAGKVNMDHKGNPALDTADFNPDGPGNLRVDYVLPSSNIEVVCGGVFWPGPDEASYNLVGPGHPIVSSDHRLVWLDILLP